MFANMKRFAAFLLALVMVFSLLPTGFVPADATEEEPQELTQAAYAEADLIFNQLDAAEEEPAKKNQTTEETVEAAMEIVMSSESYVEGSLDRNGNCFTWWTDGGIQCVYSPRMREIESQRTPETSCDEIVNEPVAVKGGSPSGNQVYLIGPYYGSDSNFTDQYKNEATRVASAIGDTDGYTLYSGKSATLDKIAEAISNGAVVFFDSHGMTDYENPYDEYDFVTGATNSYLCLTSTTGLTSADYADGALYYSDGICINGATIANHMIKNSPGGILWMAICLGMATDTMYKPLREMGVEVVYGYSQSVSFDGDYLFEEAFWSEMIDGATVAEAIASMKSRWGNWDWSDEIADYYYYTYYESGYSTISEARRYYTAFPIVVSDEDEWPGQRTSSSYGADSLQTVKSTYTLFTACEHVWTQATCTAAATCTLCGRTTGSPLPHTDANADEFCDACGKDISVAPNTYIKVTETPNDWSGQYLIVYEDGSLAFNGALSVLEATKNGFTVTIEDDTIILDDADADKYFVIEPMTGHAGSYTIKSASGFYIGNTTGTNKLEYNKSYDYWTDLSMGADGDVLMESEDYSILRFNKTQDQMRFRFYKSTSYATQGPVALYKLVEGGASAGCNHSYNSGAVTTAPTCTTAGEMTYTCTLCGDTYTNAVPATGHTWVAATCIVPQTCSVCNATTGSTADHADNNGDEACDVCGADMSTSDTPVVPPVTGGSTYEKVTTAPADWSGQYLLVYEDGSLAFDGSLTDLDVVKNNISVTIVDGRITLDAANAGSYITIAQTNGQYTVKTASGYYIGNTNNSNKLLSSTSTAYTNTLALDSDGSVLITSSGGAVMRFNALSDQMRFRYFKTSSYKSQKPVALYKLVEEAHEHEYISVVTTMPTCTTEGVATFTCECGDSYIETIEVLNHNYVDGVCTNCGTDANLTFLGGAAISFQDYIGMNIMFYNGAAAKYDKFYAVAVQIDPEEGAVETICNAVPYNYAGVDYTIFEHQVMAWSMTEQVTLTLYAEKNGVVYVGQTITTSVQALAQEKLASYEAANNTVNCAALVDMLNYGAELQKNQDHNIESLPNAGNYASYGTTTTPKFNATTSVTGSGIVGYGPSISMQAKVEFNVMYNELDLAGKTVKAIVDGEEVAILYNTEIAPGWPIARIAVAANKLRSTFTIAVYDAQGNVVSQVIETSIEACAKSHIGGTNNDLVIALMRYGDSVSKVN